MADIQPVFLPNNLPVEQNQLWLVLHKSGQGSFVMINSGYGLKSPAFL